MEDLDKFRTAHPRLMNHFWMVVLTLASCMIAVVLAGPEQLLAESISLGTGYESLFLILLTLLIGPLNMLRQRKNPVDLNFRRDAGIWAGITAVIHVIFSFQIFFDGNLLRYFFEENGSLQLNLFGLSNDVGLVALLIIVVLTALSNNYFMKRLKGKRWKNWQRFNYLLIVLTLLHTFGQQLSNTRDSSLTYGVVGLSLVVLLAQSIGFVVYRQRALERQVAAQAPVYAPAVEPESPPAIAALSRRRFIAATGAVMLTGFVGGLAVRPLLFKGDATSDSPTLPSEQARAVATATPPPASPTATPGNSFGGRTGGNTGTNPGIGGRGGRNNFGSNNPANPPSNPGTGSNNSGSNANPVPTSPATSAGNSASATGGTVLAVLASFPVGSVKQFTTPDTRENAFLVRESDGSVKAFSGVCTHRPYDLVYDQSIKQFYCSLHGACFETQNGSVTRRPARTALPPLTVQVDKQGNIVYTAA